MSQQVKQRVQELILEYRDAVRWERANELLHPQPASDETERARERVKASHSNLSMYVIKYIDNVQQFTGNLEEVVARAKQMFASPTEEPTQLPQIKA